MGTVQPGASPAEIIAEIRDWAKRFEANCEGQASTPKVRANSMLYGYESGKAIAYDHIQDKLDVLEIELGLATPQQITERERT